MADGILDEREIRFLSILKGDIEVFIVALCKENLHSNPYSPSPSLTFKEFYNALNSFNKRWRGVGGNEDPLDEGYFT